MVKIDDSDSDDGQHPEFITIDENRNDDSDSNDFMENRKSKILMTTNSSDGHINTNERNINTNDDVKRASPELIILQPEPNTKSKFITYTKSRESSRLRKQEQPPSVELRQNSKEINVLNKTKLEKKDESFENNSNGKLIQPNMRDSNINPISKTTEMSAARAALFSLTGINYDTNATLANKNTPSLYTQKSTKKPPPSPDEMAAGRAALFAIKNKSYDKNFLPKIPRIILPRIVFPKKGMASGNSTLFATKCSSDNKNAVSEFPKIEEPEIEELKIDEPEIDEPKIFEPIIILTKSPEKLAAGKAAFIKKSGSYNKNVEREYPKPNSADPNVVLLRCDECGKHFKKRKYLMKHLKIHLRDDKDIPKPNLPKVSKQIEELKVRIKSGIAQCDVCGLIFKAHRNLTKHSVVHRTEKQFTCDICQNKFTRKTNIIKHMLIHCEINPYACEICGRTFRQKTNYNRHKLIHFDVYRFKCPECFKPCKRKQDVKTHMKIHTNYHPYKCKYCGRPYRSWDGYNTHQKKCAISPPIVDDEIQKQQLKFDLMR